MRSHSSVRLLLLAALGVVAGPAARTAAPLVAQAVRGEVSDTPSEVPCTAVRSYGASRHLLFAT